MTWVSPRVAAALGRSQRAQACCAPSCCRPPAAHAARATRPWRCAAARQTRCRRRRHGHRRCRRCCWPRRGVAWSASPPAQAVCDRPPASVRACLGWRSGARTLTPVCAANCAGTRRPGTAPARRARACGISLRSWVRHRAVGVGAGRAPLGTTTAAAQECWGGKCVFPQQSHPVGHRTSKNGCRIVRIRAVHRGCDSNVLSRFRISKIDLLNRCSSRKLVFMTVPNVLESVKNTPFRVACEDSGFLEYPGKIRAGLGSRKVRDNRRVSKTDRKLSRSG